MATVNSPSSNNQVISKKFSINLAQNAGTIDLATATGGDIHIIAVDLHVNVAGTGFTSFTVQTNNTTAVTILASTTQANTTADKNLTNFTTPTYLPSGKKIQYTITGNGSAGSVDVVVRYVQVTGDLV